MKLAIKLAMRAMATAFIVALGVGSLMVIAMFLFLMSGIVHTVSGITMGQAGLVVVTVFAFIVALIVIDAPKSFWRELDLE